MFVRQAKLTDVSGMSDLLQQLTAIGKRISPSDPDFVMTHYLTHDDSLQCAVAEDVDGAILGFQSLRHATVGNIYGVAPGWGIIGTHVSPDAARRGVGKALFAATLTAARAAGLEKIDATISAQNAEGLAYYDAMGFRSYRTPTDKICKCYEVTKPPTSV